MVIFDLRKNIKFPLTASWCRPPKIMLRSKICLESRKLTFLEHSHSRQRNSWTSVKFVFALAGVLVDCSAKRSRNMIVHSPRVRTLRKQQEPSLCRENVSHQSNNIRLMWSPFLALNLEFAQQPCSVLFVENSKI